MGYQQMIAYAKHHGKWKQESLTSIRKLLARRFSTYTLKHVRCRVINLWPIYDTFTVGTIANSHLMESN